MTAGSNCTISTACESNDFEVREIIGPDTGFDGLIEDLAIDWVGRNIFWSNLQNFSIEVATLSGSRIDTISIRYQNSTKHVLENPRAVAVDPTRGTII
jgi:hypothetical protein